MKTRVSLKYFVCYCRLNIEHFQKKNMLPIADVFPKLRTPKKEVNQTSKTSRSREPFAKQHVMGTKHC